MGFFRGTMPMKKINFGNMCKIFCLLLCTAFLLTACGGDNGSGDLMHEECIPEDGATTCAPADDQDLAHAQQTCWQGSLLGLLYKDIGKMTTGVYKALTDEKLLPLIILAFSVWMAWQILKHVASPTPEAIGDFWTKIIRKAAICIVCGTLASSPANLLYTINNFIFPVYVTILEFTATVLHELEASPQAQTTAIKWPSFQSDEEICEAYVHNLKKCNFPNMDNIKMTTESFPTEPLELMSCMTCVVSDHLGMGYSIGIRLFTKGLTGTMVGIFLLVAFTIAKISFALYLIDSIFRLNVMIICLPFLILFYPFEQTRKWTVKGFQIILSSAGIMMCLGIVVTMTIFAMEKLLLDKSMGFSFGDPDSYSGFGIIAMALIFIGFIVIKACGLALELAGNVTGYSGEAGLQKKLKSLVQLVAGTAFGLLTAGAGKALTVAMRYSERVRAIVEKSRKAQAKLQKINSRIQHLAGRDNSGEGEEQ